MGDIEQFLKELPSKVPEYEESLNSVRLFKLTSNNRFDVIQLEQLRQRIAAEELPLLTVLWQSIDLVDRIEKHQGPHPGLDPSSRALNKFRPLFNERNFFGIPKIISLSKSEIDVLPKNHYKWEKFKKLFKEEKDLLERCRKKPSQPTKAPILSKKSVGALSVVLIIALFVGLSNLQGAETGTGEEVSYWQGVAPNGTSYSFIIKKFQEGNFIITDQLNNNNIYVNNVGYGNDFNEYVFINNVLEVKNNNGGLIVQMIEQKQTNRVLDRQYYLDEGNKCLESEDYGCAIMMFDRMYAFPEGREETKIKWAKAYFLNGKKLYETQDYTNALTNFQNAIRWNDKESEYYNWLGDTFYKLKNYNEALKYYNKCIELNSSDGNAFLGLGWSHFELKNNEKAKEAWKKGANLGNEGSKNNYEWILNQQK